MEKIISFVNTVTVFHGKSVKKIFKQQQQQQQQTKLKWDV
jgi:hypothetical protein